MDDDNQEITLLGNKDQYFHIRSLDVTLATKIAKSSTMDPIIMKALAAMNDKTREPWIPRTSKKDWQFDDGKLYFKQRLYIPEPDHLALIKSLHESPTGGHKGFFHALHHIQKDYWWPRISIFSQKYILGCTTCQQAKTNTHPTMPGLTPLTMETPLPFSSISIDLIMGLPDSHNFDSVMVVVDHGLTKGVIYCPCSKNIDATRIAQLFFTHVFPQFGLHSKVISNQGPQFTSAFA